MTLFKIALRNIRKNSYDYLMYFMSMIFAIMIYYTFACIKYNESFAAAIGGSQNLSSAFNAATFIMTIFSVVFIWYSNMFFTKKRKKEFGLYSLMGVRKKHIGRMYFYETILIGSLAIVGGILLGTFFSKFFTMILVKVIGYEMEVKFFFSWKQVFETLQVFIIIFIVVSLQGYYISYRYKLIDMFSSGRKKESVPKSNAILAIISIILIIGSYIMSHTFFFKNPSIGFLATLAAAITGSYIFFRHFILLGINIIKKNRKYYYKSVNMIATSLMLYRIKSNYRTLATIAIMSAVTLTTIGTSYSFYYKSYSSSKSTSPFALTYEYKGEELDRDVSEIIVAENHTILFSEKFTTLSVPLKMLYEKKLKENEFFSLDSFSGILVKESDYKKLSQYLNNYEDQSLKNGEALLLLKTYSEIMERDYKGCTVQIRNSENKFYIDNFMIKPIINSSIGYNVIVLTDNDYDRIKKTHTEKTYSVVDFSNQKDSKALTLKLSDFLRENSEYMMFYPVYMSSIVSTGLFVYIAGFLGIVFLIATGTIIFFKQLTEANEDWHKYLTLDKIGITTGEMKQIVKKQMRLIFGAPLILGIIHAAFAIDVLAIMLNTNLTIPVILSFTAYIIIYVIFYFMTCSSYFKIIQSCKNT